MILTLKSDSKVAHPPSDLELEFAENVGDFEERRKLTFRQKF